MENSAKETIGVFGHYGNKNLGDEAIIAAVVQSIKMLKPKAVINGFSISPDDTEKRHKVKSFPIRKLKKKNVRPPEGVHHPQNEKRQRDHRQKDVSSINLLKNFFMHRLDDAYFLKTILKIPFIAMRVFVSGLKEIIFVYNSFKILKKIDKLFVAGSNQFLDNFGGVAGFPYTLLKWTILARLAKVKVYFLSLGAGPIKSKISMILIKACINLCEYISFRDTGSKNLVGQQANPKAAIFPDLAFSHGYLGLDLNNQCPSKQIRKIGINPMPVYDKRYWPIVDEKKFHRYIESMAELYIALKNSGFDPFFYNTQHSDLLVIDDIVTLIGNHAHAPTNVKTNIVVCRSDQLDELMDVISSADILVPTRYHGIILSYMAEKPVVGICYGPKSREVITNVSQARYAFEVETFNAQGIIYQIKAIVNNYTDEIDRIRIKKKGYGDRLSLQYAKILK